MMIPTAAAGSHSKDPACRVDDRQDVVVNDQGHGSGYEGLSYGPQH